MITIISIENEYSTDRILDWLEYQNCNVYRLNTEDSIYTKFVMKSTSTDYYYFRKYRVPIFGTDKLSLYQKKELVQYWKELLQTIPKEQFLGSTQLEEPPRITTLLQAEIAGFKTPNSLITSSKAELLKFLKLCPIVITKPLVAPLNIICENVDIALRVSKIKREDVEQLNEQFCPTFFQEMILRDYEVRLFYLKGKCWAMAFVVKKDNEISPDIWNIKKRREIPIDVPDDIQEKVIKFMDLAGYNTGSLDFIIHDQEWYFLELNPSGQYDFVSKNCNYFLDREIAKVLIHES